MALVGNGAAVAQRGGGWGEGVRPRGAWGWSAGLGAGPLGWGLVLGVLEQLKEVAALWSGSAKGMRSGGGLSVLAVDHDELSGMLD